MQAQAQLPNGIAIALNNSPKSVAFSFLGRKPFLDLRKGILGIWDNKGFTIHGVEYAHNRWHELVEDSPLWNYVKDLVISDYQNPLENMEAFFRQE